MTSNLGADIIVGDDLIHKVDETGEISPDVRRAVMDVVSSAYPPEFLNRLDEYIIFRRLSREALRDIVDIRLRELQGRLDDRRIKIEVPEDVKQWLCDRGYDPKFGARPLNRLIAKQVGNSLADKIIRGEVKTGDVAKVLIKEGGDGLEVLQASP